MCLNWNIKGEWKKKQRDPVVVAPKKSHRWFDRDTALSLIALPNIRRNDLLFLNAFHLKTDGNVSDVLITSRMNVRTVQSITIIIIKIVLV